MNPSDFDKSLKGERNRLIAQIREDERDRIAGELFVITDTLAAFALLKSENLPALVLEAMTDIDKCLKGIPLTSSNKQES